MDFEAVEHLHVAHPLSGTDLLSRHDVGQAQLSGHRGTDNQILHAACLAAESLFLAGHVALQQLALDGSHDRIVAQVLLLQPGGARLVGVFVGRHFQFGLALDAHVVLLAVQGVAFLQPLQFVFCLQALLLQGEPVAGDFQQLAAVFDALFLQFAQFVGDVAFHLRVLQDEQGVANLHHVAFLADDAGYVAALQAVHLYGHDGMHDAFHVHVFQEVGVPDFGNLHVLLVHAELARAECQHGRIAQQGDEGQGGQQVVAVTDEPRAFL